MRRQVFRQDGPLTEHTPGLESPVDLRGSQRLARQRALKAADARQRDEHLVDLLGFAEKIIDIPDVAVDSGIVDSEPAPRHGLRVRAPGKSSSWREVVVIARKICLQF